LHAVRGDRKLDTIRLTVSGLCTCDFLLLQEFNQAGMITKAKSRRLLLLNDLIVCVAVAPKAADGFGNSERLSLKWSHPVTDVEVICTPLMWYLQEWLLFFF
jgi:Mg2+/Co2+ transporter CorB